MIIDPPTPFDTLEAWQKFLKEIENAKPTPGDPHAADDIRRHLEQPEG
jgi:hypothetical protein